MNSVTGLLPWMCFLSDVRPSSRTCRLSCFLTLWGAGCKGRRRRTKRASVSKREECLVNAALCDTPISRTTTAQSPQLSTDAPNVTRHRGFIAKATSAGAAYGGASGAEKHNWDLGSNLNLENEKNGVGYEISASGLRHPGRLVARVCLLPLPAHTNLKI